MDQNTNNTGDKISKDSSVGPAIGIIIIIAVLIVGALYFWGSRLNKDSEKGSSNTKSTSTGQYATTTP